MPGLDPLADLAYRGAAEAVEGRYERLQERAVSAHADGREEEAQAFLSAARWLWEHPARGNLEGPPVHALERVPRGEPVRFAESGAVLAPCQGGCGVYVADYEPCGSAQCFGGAGPEPY